METTKRAALKSVTWQLSGILVMGFLGVLLTGSWSVAGRFAVASSVIGFVMYIIHERIWSCISWGRPHL